MALSLKDPETDQLARKVSQLTGETITQAITIALRERLDRLEHNYDMMRKVRIQEILDQFKAKVPLTAKSSDHSEMLYGKDGLPK
ncbi:MAG TPA: type II toxin-antitoxin system VapB family antitoxin [Leptospiraceae bacterium]|nr:type II toxin-antitoxin system VapB family antitoxin [Leptospiraceae bacterium]HMY66732.1 type II toxin-antitoxin system VapB family antitoxin [Leptospiraceae bacterium]HMZ57471.1 type II toxin-antitoxin system VapB family antitoxin [Leptospiraceae bacterium]HNF12089.1 type II toxin-antitoxin system VapB family antitoxin [Leptospiraceae bacterium]HNF26171.1 type II toxin-antitoxin system VapB family antitoxin [Leptospiraceae bacterium]